MVISGIGAVTGGSALTKKKDLVQVRNPKTDRYVKIDRGAGRIVSHEKRNFASERRHQRAERKQCAVPSGEILQERCPELEAGAHLNQLMLQGRLQAMPENREVPAAEDDQDAVVGRFGDGFQV